jgi:adenylate cyclase
LADLGRLDDAVAEGRHAAELDPLSQIINYQLGLILVCSRRYDAAKDQAQKGIELDPTFPWNYYIRGLVAEMRGRFDEAILDYQNVKLLSHDDPTTLGEIGRACALAGRKEQALEMLQQLTEHHKNGLLVSYSIANIYHGLGDTESTFEWLERSFQDEEGLWGNMLNDPLWDNLRSHPQYIALLQKMELIK